MKRTENRPAEPGSPWVTWTCTLMVGGLVAGGVAVVGLLAGAALISAGVLAEGWIDGLVLALCVLGSMAGSWFALRRLSGGGLLPGLAVGLVLFLLLLTAGVLVYGSVSPERGGGGLGACLCGGGIVGLLRHNKPKKRRRSAH